MYSIDANIAIDILSNIMIREADRSRAVFSSIDGAAPPGVLDHGAEYLAGGRKDEASAEHRPGDHSRDTIRAGLRQVAFDPEIVVTSLSDYHATIHEPRIDRLEPRIVNTEPGRHRRSEIVD